MATAQLWSHQIRSNRAVGLSLRRQAAPVSKPRKRREGEGVGRRLCQLVRCIAIEHTSLIAHQVRSMLTEQKLSTQSKLFTFVSLEDNKEACGTVTADLFAEDGEGYPLDIHCR